MYNVGNSLYFFTKKKLHIGGYLILEILKDKNNLQKIILTIDLVVLAILFEWMAKFLGIYNLITIPFTHSKLFVFSKFFLMLIAVFIGSFLYTFLGILFLVLFGIIISFSSVYTAFSSFESPFLYCVLHFFLKIIIPNFCYLLFCFCPFQQRPYFSYKKKFFLIICFIVLLETFVLTINGYYLWLPLINQTNNIKKLTESLPIFNYLIKRDFFFCIIFILNIICSLTNNFFNMILVFYLFSRLRKYDSLN